MKNFFAAAIILIGTICAEVITGIIVGGSTVLIWKQFELFGLYEIVPGFIFALIAIFLVSKFDSEPDRDILETFDKVDKSEI